MTNPDTPPAALYARYDYATRSWSVNAYEDGNRLTEFGMHGNAYALPQAGHVNPALRQARQTALQRLPGWDTQGPWTQGPTPSQPAEVEYRIALARTGPTLTATARQSLANQLLVKPAMQTAYAVGVEQSRRV